MLTDEVFKDVPEYYPTMYLDGFTPEEIMYAKKKKYNVLEDGFMAATSKSLKSALDLAIDKILKSLK